jgi:hypothetical protein
MIYFTVQANNQYIFNVSKNLDFTFKDLGTVKPV